MHSLFAGAAGGGENQPIAGNPVDLVDEQKVENYISKTGLSSIEITGLESKLRKIKAQNDSGLTMFGLIAFGKAERIDEKPSFS